MTSLSAFTKGVLAGADAHTTRGRPLTLHPNELCIVVGEYARPGENHVCIREDNAKGNVLVIGSSLPQPLLAFHFLATEYHPRTATEYPPRTVTAPLDSGDFDIVCARDHSRALGITRYGVKGLASRICDCRVENIGGTGGEGELE